ncbi:tetratricopeptide repeat protein [Ovoidimarina sediminis]|uniref:tetratricopeptide repeat protein n=1 Tax=Ovoidimarina sediminis TaxID=3079856 RepID=UPI002909F90D|nr:tetratricopeptide repeat protein [Rhodophyticola sp. MJ-SS7]MDU8944442.1 tetratricopeptide repeat protein [Rhodophyticola sp. MJ-SS7]
MTDYPYDLGTYDVTITAANDDARLWARRGLLWTYGFNHEEAVACFDQALAADPNCAFAHWGRAYALGPNYNMAWEHMDAAMQADATAACHAAIAAARDCTADVAPWEADLIEALAARFPQAEPAELDVMEGWNADFADAMRPVAARHPGNLEVASVFAEALLNLTPWQMWDLPTGTPAEGAATEEVQAFLEGLFDTHPGAMAHPGLLHLYVHLMEMSPFPERALKHGDVLRTIVPDAGHLVHMPTHIDVLCGHYENVVRWNEAAVVADEKFWRDKGAFNIYTGYRLHNYHFVIYGAMFLGQLQPALTALRGARDTVPDEMLRMESPPMADYFEAYLGFEPHVLVRFGLWREATELELPEDPDLFCTHAANVHYARGVGHAALGEIDRAEAEEALYLEAMARVPETRLLHNNRVLDLLAIGREMLRGEILYRKGEYDAAFAALRRSVALDDALLYDEPWGWMQPTRHALGALLFEQGRTAEAEAVYREDLGLGGTLSRATIHPDNVWALRGLHDCLKARGEEVEIRQVRQRLDLAEARADRRVAASCFCAQSAMAAG